MGSNYVHDTLERKNALVQEEFWDMSPTGSLKVKGDSEFFGKFLSSHRRPSLGATQKKRRAHCPSQFWLSCFGAGGEIRTLTGVTPQTPEACASASSATSANDLPKGTLT